MHTPERCFHSAVAACSPRKWKGTGVHVQSRTSVPGPVMSASSSWRAVPGAANDSTSQSSKQFPYSRQSSKANLKGSTARCSPTFKPIFKAISYFNADFGPIFKAMFKSQFSSRCTSFYSVKGTENLASMETIEGSRCGGRSDRIKERWCTLQNFW